MAVVLEINYQYGTKKAAFFDICATQNDNFFQSSTLEKVEAFIAKESMDLY